MQDVWMSKSKCCLPTGMRRCLSMSSHTECASYWCLSQNNHSRLKLRQPILCKSFSVMFIAAEVDRKLVLGFGISQIKLSSWADRSRPSKWLSMLSVSWTLRVFTRCSLAPCRQPVPEELRCHCCSVTSWMFLLVWVGAQCLCESLGW